MQKWTRSMAKRISEFSIFWSSRLSSLRGRKKTRPLSTPRTKVSLRQAGWLLQDFRLSPPKKPTFQTQISVNQLWDTPDAWLQGHPLSGLRRGTKQPRKRSQSWLQICSWMRICYRTWERQPLWSHRRSIAGREAWGTRVSRKIAKISTTRTQPYFR